MRHFGRIAFFGAVASWAVLALTLALGGLDPKPALGRMLQALATGAIVCAFVSCGVAIVALLAGHARASAAMGLVLGLLFLLAFTGAGFGLLR